MNDEYALDIRRKWLFEKARERKQESQRSFDQCTYRYPPRRSKRSDLLDAIVMATYLDKELVIIDPKGEYHD